MNRQQNITNTRFDIELNNSKNLVTGGAGILFEKGNSKHLADIIVNLHTNLDYYNSIDAKCKQMSEQFDILIMVEKHISLYKSRYEA